jgi:hypothetical protein
MILDTKAMKELFLSVGLRASAPELEAPKMEL